MKSEKAIAKLKDGSAQQRLTARGIAAYSLALALIARELGEEPEQKRQIPNDAAHRREIVDNEDFWRHMTGPIDFSLSFWEKSRYNSSPIVVYLLFTRF